MRKSTLRNRETEIETFTAPDLLAEKSLQEFRLRLGELINRLRILAWPADPEITIPLTKYSTEQISHDFLAETLKPRQTLSRLARKDFGQLNLRNQLLIKNYDWVSKQILRQVQVLQIGTESELPVAIAMLDLYFSDLSTLEPPPIGHVSQRVRR